MCFSSSQGSRWGSEASRGLRSLPPSPTGVLPAKHVGLGQGWHRLFKKPPRFLISKEKATHLCPSVQFNWVAQLSDSLWPREPLHPRTPWPLPAPRVRSNPCPLSQWCHLTIWSSVIPFSSHLQSFLWSGSFPMSQFFASGGQSIAVSASAWVLPMNTYDWFPLGWPGWGYKFVYLPGESSL